MKKPLFTLLVISFVLLSSNTTFAQTTGIPKHAIFYKFLQIDHYSPAGDDNANFLEDYTTGAELGYSHNFTERISLNVPLKLGIGNYPVKDQSGNTTSFTGDKLYFSADVTGSLRLLKYDNWFNPYIMAGAGVASRDGEKVHGQFPVGAGINLRLSKGLFVNLQYEKRLVGGDNDENNQIGLGLWVPFGKGLEEEPKELPPVDSDGDGITDKDDSCPQEPGLAAFGGCPDTDSDGIPDKDDECPEVAGVQAFNGCPDTDNDGLADKNDECPEVAGPIANKGCPIQDRDSDGTPDDQDACPDEAGPASLQGCPDGDNDGVVDSKDECPTVAGKASLNGCPDRDNDGLVDSKDKCPDKAGPIANQGCPEIKKEEKEILNFAMRAIQFETASATLKTSSNTVLDQVADILKKYPAYSVSIDGHTDSIGKEDNNQRLSEKRAKSCYDYLVSKGIPSSSLSYTGYGETRPIADNKYKDGRKLNRRVEFNIFLK